MEVSRKEVTTKEIESLTQILTGFKEDMKMNNEKFVCVEPWEKKEVLKAYTTNKQTLLLAEVTMKRLIELTESKESEYLGRTVINMLREYIKTSQETLDKQGEIMELVKGEILKITD